MTMHNEPGGFNADFVDAYGAQSWPSSLLSVTVGRTAIMNTWAGSVIVIRWSAWRFLRVMFRVTMSEFLALGWARALSANDWK